MAGNDNHSVGDACPPLLFPEKLPCSGRGQCVSPLICVCEPGWTGLGDFAFASPSCNINVDAVKALWGVLAILHFLQIFWGLNFLRKKIQLNRKSSRRSLAIIMMTLMLAGNICFSIVGAFRFAHTELRTIGNDPLVTLLFCFGCSLYWSMIHVFGYSFVELIHAQALIFRHRGAWIVTINRSKRLIKISALMSVIFSMFPIGMLTSSGAVGHLTYGSIHYLGLAVTIFIPGMLIFPYYLGQLISELQQGHDAVIDSLNGEFGDAFQYLLHRVHRFKSQMINQVIPQCIFALMFGCWPFLQVYGSSYYLPIAWISGCFGGYLIMYLSSPVNRVGKASSSSDGDKQTKSPQLIGIKTIQIHDGLKS